MNAKAPALDPADPPFLVQVTDFTMRVGWTRKSKDFRYFCQAAMMLLAAGQELDLLLHLDANTEYGRINKYQTEFVF